VLFSGDKAAQVTPARLFGNASPKARCPSALTSDWPSIGVAPDVLSYTGVDRNW